MASSPNDKQTKRTTFIADRRRFRRREPKVIKRKLETCELHRQLPVVHTMSRSRGFGNETSTFLTKQFTSAVADAVAEAWKCFFAQKICPKDLIEK